MKGARIPYSFFLTSSRTVPSCSGCHGGTSRDKCQDAVYPSFLFHSYSDPLFGTFEFSPTESTVDLDMLTARYNDPGYWSKVLQEEQEVQVS